VGFAGQQLAKQASGKQAFEYTDEVLAANDDDAFARAERKVRLLCAD